MTDWFTSDWHFFHRNVIRYCDRPFKNEKEMGDVIIRNHNEVVKKTDNVYVIGDTAMLSPTKIMKLKPVLDKMNGTKHLILGNHDEGKPFTYEKIGFTTVHTALLYDKERNIILRHDPASCVVSPESLWLVGHVHNLFKIITDPIVCYNVGVDVNNFYPVDLDHIYKEIDLLRD